MKQYATYRALVVGSLVISSSAWALPQLDRGVWRV
jgi:hypothetical protein